MYNYIIVYYYYLIQTRFPDLAELQQQRAQEFRNEQKAQKRAIFEQEKVEQKERIKAAQQKSYA